MGKTDKIAKTEQACSRDIGILSTTYCGLSGRWNNASPKCPCPNS